VLAAASASIAFNCDLVSSLGCVNTGFRKDITFSTGRLQTASDGLAMILGLAVGGLCPRFKPMRSNLAHTALRLWPTRVAIWAALRPLAQSFLSSAMSFVSQLMGDTYTPNADDRLVALLTPLQPSDNLVVNAMHRRGEVLVKKASLCRGNVRFGAHSRLKSDIASRPKSARNGHRHVRSACLKTFGRFAIK
jgi:hypothetical protein